jgi:uncharacterized protein with von Willebrand factor type A (vWA) domain
MLSFQQAKKHHVSVANAAEENEECARELWCAIVGSPDGVSAGSYGEAVRDTLPQDLQPVLATDAVAAALALSTHAPNALHATTTRSSAVLLRDAARRNWASFAAASKDVEKLARGFGWDLSEAWKTYSEVAISFGNTAQVARIAALAGRMYANLRGANAKRVASVGGEIYSVEQGNNLGRLLASESMLLVDSDLELPVLERIATRRALQYSVRGTSKCSRGPLVVLLDESGSMHDQRREWSKAAAIAIARVAKDEKRAFVTVHFSTSCVVQPVDAKKPADVLEMVRSFLNGGTAIGLALGAGLDEVERLAAKGQTGADLILVTDGVDGDHVAMDREVARAAAANVRLWTVAIDQSIPETAAIRAKAAGYIHVHDRDLGDACKVTGLAGVAR